MSELFQVSQSKVKKWRQCRYAYDCRYVQKLKKKKKSRPLQVGTMVHEMLEANAEGDCPFELLDKWEKDHGKMFRAEREMYGDIITDIRTIMTAYFDFYAKDKVRDIRYKKQYAEHWLEVPIDEEILFVMKVDGFARTPNKLRWILEHKTFKRKPNDDDRWRNLQSAVYIKACQLLKMKPFDGMLWNYIHNKPPTIPQVLKNGDLSSRNINTLPSVVRQVMEDHDIEESDNTAKVMAHAERNVKDWFFRVFTPVNSSIVDLLFDEFVITAREIMENHGKKTDRNIGMHCGWSCDYEPICRAALTGGDVDFVKEREYDCGKKQEDEQEEDKQEENQITVQGRAERKARRTRART